MSTTSQHPIFYYLVTVKATAVLKGSHGDAVYILIVDDTTVFIRLLSYLNYRTHLGLSDSQSFRVLFLSPAPRPRIVGNVSKETYILRLYFRANLNSQLRFDSLHIKPSKGNLPSKILYYKRYAAVLVF